jgi:hypothetical protein
MRVAGATPAEIVAAAADIPALVLLLARESGAAVQEHAARALMILCVHDANSVSIVAAGAVQRLVLLLRPSSPSEVWEAAAGVLSILAGKAEFATTKKKGRWCHPSTGPGS